MGGRFGWPGIAMTTLSAILLTLIFAALSNAVALLVRQQEALIGISQFTALPLTFLSSAVMDLALAPHWIQVVARYNPLDWAVVVSRQTLGDVTDGPRCGRGSGRWWWRPWRWAGWPPAPSGPTSVRPDRRP